KFYSIIRSNCGHRCRGCHVIAATIAVIAGYIPNQEVFDLCGPVVGERHFNHGAGRPAEFRIILRRQAAQRSLQIRTGAAGSPVEQDSVPRIAKAPTERSQPTAKVRRVYGLLHKAITTFSPATARAKSKENACHYRLSDAGALGIFLNTKTLF